MYCRTCQGTRQVAGLILQRTAHLDDSVGLIVIVAVQVAVPQVVKVSA